jgi:hypothetical protein
MNVAVDDVYVRFLERQAIGAVSSEAVTAEGIEGW